MMVRITAAYYCLWTERYSSFSLSAVIPSVPVDFCLREKKGLAPAALIYCEPLEAVDSVPAIFDLKSSSAVTAECC